MPPLDLGLHTTRRRHPVWEARCRLLLISLLLGVAAAENRRPKSVQVSLRAKWPGTSLLLEDSCYILYKALGTKCFKEFHVALVDASKQIVRDAGLYMILRIRPYYLKRKINKRKIELELIPEVDLYKCEPWDLPGSIRSKEEGTRHCLSYWNNPCFKIAALEEQQGLRPRSPSLHRRHSRLRSPLPIVAARSSNRRELSLGNDHNLRDSDEVNGDQRICPNYLKLPQLELRTSSSIFDKLSLNRDVLLVTEMGGSILNAKKKTVSESSTSCRCGSRSSSPTSSSGATSDPSTTKIPVRLCLVAGSKCGDCGAGG